MGALTVGAQGQLPFSSDQARRQLQSLPLGISRQDL
jgi:hypothetical protein